MKAVVIGASTGGPRALEEILKGLPADFKAVVIVFQHLPRKFTQSMVERLKQIIALPVHHLAHGDYLHEGNIYVVPGNTHFFMVTPRYRVFLLEAEGMNHPSIDMGFTSVAEHFGPDTIGVILTGMGDDGVLGAKTIKQLGGKVLVQDESTSAVYGMPFAVKVAGFADVILPLSEFTNKLLEIVNGNK